MSNPFEAKFESECQNCGDTVDEGEEMFAVEGEFWCRDCAKRTNNICKCGNYKKDEFDSCFTCKSS